MTVPRSLRLPEETWEALVEEAKRRGKSPHAFLVETVKERLSSDKPPPGTHERDTYDLAAGMEVLMEEMNGVLNRLALQEDIYDEVKRIQKILNQHR